LEIIEQTDDFDPLLTLLAPHLSLSVECPCTAGSSSRVGSDKADEEANGFREYSVSLPSGNCPVDRGVDVEVEVCRRGSGSEIPVGVDGLAWAREDEDEDEGMAEKALRCPGRVG
jgi:hypothetical protein